MRESDVRYHFLFEEAQDGIALADAENGEIVDCNQAMCLMTERDKTELQGQPHSILHPQHQLKNGHSPSFRLHKTEDPGKALEDNLLSKSGKMIPVEIRASRVRLNGRDYLLGIFRDITARKQAEAELKNHKEPLEELIEERTAQLKMANDLLRFEINERKQAEEALRESENRYRELSIVDDLTQLYNFRYFYAQLKIELDRSNRYSHPLTLLLLDLDDFKAFNDAYGHIEGDQVLLRLGQVVKRCLRQTDLAYRYGGDEFTILLPMTTSVDGAPTAERIRRSSRRRLSPRRRIRTAM